MAFLDLGGGQLFGRGPASHAGLRVRRYRRCGRREQCRIRLDVSTGATSRCLNRSLSLSKLVDIGFWFTFFRAVLDSACLWKWRAGSYLLGCERANNLLIVRASGAKRRFIQWGGRVSQMSLAIGRFRTNEESRQVSLPEICSGDLRSDFVGTRLVSPWNIVTLCDHSIRIRAGVR
jgi:hypothetical protein